MLGFVSFQLVACSLPRCPHSLRALVGLEEVLQARVAANLQAGPVQRNLQLAPGLAVYGRMGGEC